MITAILIGAGQRGAAVYAKYALEHPEDINIVAVAEPNKERREHFAKEHNILPEYVFEDWNDLLALEKIADCAMVCTQDKFHIEPVKVALSKGYHVMCEKPMSPSARECVEMGQYAEKYNRTLTICHVLRYSPFYVKLKEVLESGVIGDIVSMQHIECVGYWHQAHSFVRGNWRKEEETSPMILAKSCHDMDILVWLLDKKCEKVSSFGSLKHFCEEEAPIGSGKRCLVDCQIEETCPYSAKKIYLVEEEWYSDTIRKVVSLDDSPEKMVEALKEGPYGRCVYHCDNDVVDHQVVNLLFEDGVTVSFTMAAFTYEGSRVMNIMGTRGQILGDMERNKIEVKEFLTGNKTEIHIKTSAGGHSGSDDRFMKGFIKTVQSEGEYSVSSANMSVSSHLIALAAEESRVEGTTIDLQEFRAKFEK